jgi:beta-fructofuranosidase
MMFIRRKMAGDPHRPHYHFLAPANWMNDPNGLIQWKGHYHLFYQYNPHGAYHGKIHWGHAVSRDLIHWEDLPLALSPDPGGLDAEGCWSGCAVDNAGTPTLIYTATHPQTVCLAEGSDDLVTWEKFGGNPVIDGPPAKIRDQAGGHFRDPFVWRDGERWLMVIGTKIEGQGGMILLYESQDLKNWNYLHPIAQGNVQETDLFWTGTMWECPNLIDFGKKQVLLISAQSTPLDHLYVFYFIGEFHDGQFDIKQQRILVPTHYFYAPQIMVLDDGRVILWGWVCEGRSAQACIEAGWNGMFSLPLECSLSVDGKIKLAPLAELQTLRKRQHHLEDVELNKDFLDVIGQALELQAQFEVGSEAVFGLKLRCSPDGEEETRIVFQDQQVCIDQERASVSPEVNRNVTKMPVDMDHRVSLRVYLDHSIIELFVNDESYLVSRIYPSRNDSLGIAAFGEGQVNLSKLDIWEMENIWTKGG